MVNYIVVIPSYNRSETLKKKTLATLLNHKIETKKIYIFVANKEEENVYKKAIYGNFILTKIMITFKKGRNKCLVWKQKLSGC